LLEVDGGVNLEKAPKLFSHGANVLVAGSSIFQSRKSFGINTADEKLLKSLSRLWRHDFEIEKSSVLRVSNKTFFRFFV
jgi:3-keto-L-gulonate-6-phosphate decarboxylase